MTSPHAPRRLVIATGESALAMWQARHVQTRLQSLYPRASIELLVVAGPRERASDARRTGSADREVEAALAEGRADVVVHALRDVPRSFADGFAMAAVEARDDPRDAVVSIRHTSLAALPPKSVVATSTASTELQLRERMPSLDVRGLNCARNDPLRELSEGRCEAIVLAAADAKCLGLANLVCELIDPAESLPAPGQGMLVLECRADRADVIAVLAPLNDTATLLAATAERAFVRALAGGSETPLAAHASWQEGNLWLRGLIGTRDGRHVIRGQRDREIVDANEAEALGVELADEFLRQGAGRLIVND